MDPFTLAAVYFGSRIVMGVINEITNSSSTVSSTKISSPDKVITFIGATGAGKSSTINALVGNNILEVGVEHGTTMEVREINYLAGYRLRDTPGFLDDINFNSTLHNAFKDSELVIYTTAGQLYKPELELISYIYNTQIKWNTELECCKRRKLSLYVNKQDIKICSMDSTTCKKEILAIKEQVSAWIPAHQIAFGASSPFLRENREIPQIEELKKLILLNITE
jgi:predicted GTPase